MVQHESKTPQAHEEIRKHEKWDFLGGPVVKNPPSNAGDAGSITGRGTKIPRATGQLSPCTATTEPAGHN